MGGIRDSAGGRAASGAGDSLTHADHILRAGACRPATYPAYAGCRRYRHTSSVKSTQPFVQSLCDNPAIGEIRATPSASPPPVCSCLFLSVAPLCRVSFDRMGAVVGGGVGARRCPPICHLTSPPAVVYHAGGLTNHNERKSMKYAIGQLEESLATLVANEPINRADGKAEQADLELATADSIRAALAVLRGVRRPEWQKRVIEEKEILDSRLERLDNFIGKSLYCAASRSEQERLCRQASIMRDYSAVLGERIAAFETED